MTLAANALCTVSDVKEELGLDPSNADSDSYIETLINSASFQIENFLGRRLSYVAAEVEDVRGYGGFRITVSKTPVHSVASIELVDPYTPSVSIDISEVQIDDSDAGMLYYRGGFPWTVPVPPGSIVGNPLTGQEQKSIRVTYEAGYNLPPSSTDPDLPLDIRRAAALCSATNFRSRGRDLNIQRESLMSYSVTYFNPVGATATQAKMFPGTSLPQSVMMMLLPYRKISGA